MIIIQPHEATDSSVSSGACFNDYVLKSGNEKVVCENIGYKAQTLYKKGMNRFLSTSTLLCIFGKRLFYILMKQQTHQSPLGPVFMITS